MATQEIKDTIEYEADIQTVSIALNGIMGEPDVFAIKKEYEYNIIRNRMKKRAPDKSLAIVYGNFEKMKFTLIEVENKTRLDYSFLYSKQGKKTGIILAGLSFFMGISAIIISVLSILTNKGDPRPVLMGGIIMFFWGIYEVRGVSSKKDQEKQQLLNMYFFPQLKEYIKIVEAKK